MRGGTLLAAVTGALLAGVLWLELLPGDAPSDAGPEPSVAVGAPDPPHPDAAPIAAWTEAVLARPLFNPDRKPTPAKHSGGITLPRLAGTIRTDRGDMAIFQPAQGKPIVLGRGGVIAEWTVAEIADGVVVLQRGEATSTLRMSYSNLPVPSPQPARPAQLLVLHDRRTNPFLQP